MAKTAEKSFCILEILYRYSDEDNPMNATDIIRKLTSYGIETDRRSIYRCIEGLEESGYEIIKSGRSGWFIGRTLETAEIKILVDAIQQSHFLTRKKSEELIKKLLTLTSEGISRELLKQVSLDNRPKHDNEEIYYNVDKINTAIVKNKQITFKYFEYNEKGEKVMKKNGYVYRVSPFFTSWFAENYYMICATKDYPGFSHYRIEKMTDINILPDTRRSLSELAPEGFNLANYLVTRVSMFSGQPEQIRLKINNEIASQIFDKFGTGISLIPANGEYSFMNTEAVIEKGLISWIVSYRENIEVIKPERLKEEILAHCKSITALYEKLL